jgi:hypothetical protein
LRKLLDLRIPFSRIRWNKFWKPSWVKSSRRVAIDVHVLRSATTLKFQQQVDTISFDVPSTTDDEVVALDELIF